MKSFYRAFLFAMILFSGTPPYSHAQPSSIFYLEPFIVNVAGSEGKWFTRVSIALELSDSALVDEIKANLPKIKDAILLILSSKDFEEVYMAEGKVELRNQITSRVNSFLKTGSIKSYFTEFVIEDISKMNDF